MRLVRLVAVDLQLGPCDIENQHICLFPVDLLRKLDLYESSGGRPLHGVMSESVVRQVVRRESPEEAKKLVPEVFILFTDVIPVVGVVLIQKILISSQIHAFALVGFLFSLIFANIITKKSLEAVGCFVFISRCKLARVT